MKIKVLKRVKGQNDCIFMCPTRWGRGEGVSPGGPLPIAPQWVILPVSPPTTGGTHQVHNPIMHCVLLGSAEDEQELLRNSLPADLLSRLGVLFQHAICQGQEVQHHQEVVQESGRVFVFFPSTSLASTLKEVVETGG